MIPKAETPAEETLIAAMGTPGRITVGTGDRPSEAAPDVAVRAELIRALLLHGDGVGLRLKGAWITGKLDLQGCDCPRDITLSNCHVTEQMVLINAGLRGLHLQGSVLHGIAADNARFAGSVYVRGDSLCRGEIALAGARIGGDLQLCGAQVLTDGQDAVFAPSVHIDGSLFLGNYVYGEGITTLVARGTVFFASAIVGHDVFVTNTAISLNDGIVGTVFGETEEHGAEMALSLGRARIGGILYLRDNQIGAMVNLAGATCARFRDEPQGPGANYPIRLDGFRYGDFSRHADTGLAGRLAWLERRPEGTPFTAQPYEHLAAVLRQLGHREDADRVMIRKEQLLRAENRRSLREERRLPVAAAVVAGWDGFLRWSVGFGYRPGRSILFAVALIAGFGWLMQRTWAAGDMAPNSAPILVSPGWVAATQAHPSNPAEAWAAPGAPGQDWETFHPVAYAADVVIPLIQLGQESAWAPSTSRSDWGRAAWWLRWFAKGIGWVIAALLAAAVTGVIRKD